MNDDQLEPMTWTCHACSEVRDDTDIAVLSRDLSSECGFEPGLASWNIRYCADRPACLLRAQTMRWGEQK